MFYIRYKSIQGFIMLGNRNITINSYVLDQLITSFDYIEKIRSFGVNKGGQNPRFSKDKLADLYYAGLPIYNLVIKHGNQKQKDRLELLIARYKPFFD